jgi:hypothetical protein
MNQNQYSYHASTFIFSLVNPTNTGPIMLPNSGLYHTNTYSIYSSVGVGPTFGGGHDISICNGCNTLNSSYSNLGHSFQCPPGITYGTVQANNFLAGSYNFIVSEIEVFYLK